MQVLCIKGSGSPLQFGKIYTVCGEVPPVCSHSKPCYILEEFASWRPRTMRCRVCKTPIPHKITRPLFDQRRFIPIVDPDVKEELTETQERIDKLLRDLERIE